MTALQVEIIYAKPKKHKNSLNIQNILNMLNRLHGDRKENFGKHLSCDPHGGSRSAVQTACQTDNVTMLRSQNPRVSLETRCTHLSEPPRSTACIFFFN